MVTMVAQLPSEAARPPRYGPDAAPAAPAAAAQPLDGSRFRIES